MVSGSLLRPGLDVLDNFLLLLTEGQFVSSCTFGLLAWLLLLVPSVLFLKCFFFVCVAVIFPPNYGYRLLIICQLLKLGLKIQKEQCT